MPCSRPRCLLSEQIRSLHSRFCMATDQESQLGSCGLDRAIFNQPRTLGAAISAVHGAAARSKMDFASSGRSFGKTDSKRASKPLNTGAAKLLPVICLIAPRF